MTIFKQEGPSIDYPEEPNRPRPFVVQIHWRGVGAHLDLRFLVSDYAEGWTVSCQKPGVVKVPVVSLFQARALFRDQEIWKFDLKTGRVFPRKVRTSFGGRPREIIREGALLAHRKAGIVPKEWLDVEGRTPWPPDFLETVLEFWEKWPPEVQRELKREGLTPEFARAVLEGRERWKNQPDRIPVGATRAYPGVFHVVCRGQFTLGARKPWFFEYFVEDSDGLYQPGQRLLFRLVRRAEKGEWEEAHIFEKDEVLPPAAVPEEEVLPGYWLFMTPDPEGDIPYVLSEEALEKEWLPPYPASALPLSWQKRVPPSLRYWEERDQDKALQMRAKIVEQLKEGALEKATRNRFFYSVVAFRGPIQVRWGPSKVLYYLGLEFGDKRYLFALDNDIRVRETVAGLTVDRRLWKPLEELGDWQDLEPGTLLNPTKDTPARGRRLDEGPAQLLLEKPGFLKVRLEGQELTGDFAFGEEMPGAGIWLVGISRKISAKAEQRGFYRSDAHPELVLVDGKKVRRFKLASHLVKDGFVFADLEEGVTVDSQAEWTVTGSWFMDQEEDQSFTFSFPELGQIGLPVTWMAQRIWTGQWLLAPLELSRFSVVHKDVAKRIVYGVVLTPYGPDAQGDIVPPEEIERAAHLYLIFGRQIGIHHEGDPILAFPVESFIAPCDFEYVPGDPETRVRKGEWVLAAKIFDEEVWEKIVKGELTGWSIQGFGRRIPLNSLGEESSLV